MGTASRRKVPLDGMRASTKTIPMSLRLLALSLAKLAPRRGTGSLLRKRTHAAISDKVKLCPISVAQTGALRSGIGRVRSKKPEVGGREVSMGALKNLITSMPNLDFWLPDDTFRKPKKKRPSKGPF